MKKSIITLFITMLALVMVQYVSAQVIVIDPGHGYTSTGGNPDGRTSTEILTNLAVGLKLRDQLESGCSNWTIHMTRTTDSGWISLSQRRTMSNDWGADRFLSIHCNAGGGTGTETFWCNQSNSSSTDNTNFSNTIQTHMVSKGQWNSRRVAEDNSYLSFHLGVLNGNNAIGCLNEIGFVDSSDEPKLLSDSWRDIFAEAYFDAITDDVQSSCTGGGGGNPGGDTVAPTTSLSAQGGATQSDDFIVDFTDNDNVGVTRTYYTVLEKYGNSWRANRNNGFFNDNCENLYSVYTAGDGSWASSNGKLVQTNTTSTNTSLSSYLAQNSGLPQLYEFSARMVSTSGPQKFGIHFMADDASLSQRGNSYLVWFSGAEGKLRIYKTISNALYTQAITDITVDNNWADYKITYSPAYGVMEIFRDGESLLQWTDSSPLQSGNAISLRTNQSSVEFDDIKVFKYRVGNNVTVTVGSASTDDARQASADGVSPSCKVQSLVRDAAGNWSTTGNLDIVINFGSSTMMARTSDDVVLYPNPTSGQSLKLFYLATEQAALDIAILDLAGHTIRTNSTLSLPTGRHEVDITHLVNELVAGQYLITIQNGNDRVVKRIIKH